MIYPNFGRIINNATANIKMSVAGKLTARTLNNRDRRKREILNCTIYRLFSFVMCNPEDSNPTYFVASLLPKNPQPQSRRTQRDNKTATTGWNADVRTNPLRVIRLSPPHVVRSHFPFNPIATLAFAAVPRQGQTFPATVPSAHDPC